MRAAFFVFCMLMNSTEIAYYKKMIEGSNQRNINKYRSGFFSNSGAVFVPHQRLLFWGLYVGVEWESVASIIERL